MIMIVTMVMVMIAVLCVGRIRHRNCSSRVNAQSVSLDGMSSSKPPLGNPRFS